MARKGERLAPNGCRRFGSEWPRQGRTTCSPVPTEAARTPCFEALLASATGLCQRKLGMVLQEERKEAKI